MPRLPKELREDTPTQAGPAVGDVLQDQFRIDAFLGRGGMGEVYKGTDLALERTVAIKVLPGILAGSSRAARALRKEAARAIELTHRSLARVYFFGQAEERNFLVMEFLEGETLTERLDREEELRLDAALEILGPLADALDYAHAEGVVHRDVKPSNILLRSSGPPVLIDFGIAAEVRDQTTKHGETASPAETLGTLSYMSPEQARGKRPAPSMDIYSLAATAYEMLGGEPPFYRGDPLTVHHQILNEEPEPLEHLPDPVWAALARGLAKDPAARYPTAVALVEALRGEVDVGAETVVETGGVDPGAATEVEGGGESLLDRVVASGVGPAEAPAPEEVLPPVPSEPDPLASGAEVQDPDPLESGLEGTAGVGRASGITDPRGTVRRLLLRVAIATWQLGMGLFAVLVGVIVLGSPMKAATEGLPTFFRELIELHVFLGAVLMLPTVMACLLARNLVARENRALAGIWIARTYWAPLLVWVFFEPMELLKPDVALPTLIALAVTSRGHRAVSRALLMPSLREG